MTNVGSVMSETYYTDFKDDESRSSEQSHQSENIISTGFRSKPPLSARRYNRRRQRLLSAYKSGRSNRLKTRQQHPHQEKRLGKLANLKLQQTPDDQDQNTDTTTELDSDSKQMSTYKIRFQHHNVCEQPTDSTANLQEPRRSNTNIHNDAFSSNSSNVSLVDTNDANGCSETDDVMNRILSLPRLPEMKGSGLVTKSLSGKVIRGLPDSKSSNWIMVGPDGNHHLRQPTPAPVPPDSILNEFTRPLPSIQDSLTEVFDWGLRSNKLTLSALMQVDHKQACLRDESFEFGKELLLQSQRAENVKATSTECLQDAEPVRGVDRSRSGHGVAKAISREREITDSSIEKGTKKKDLWEVGVKQDGEEDELQEAHQDEESDLEHCQAPTVILTPVPTATKAKRTQQDIPIKQIELNDLNVKKLKLPKQCSLPRIHSRSTLPEEAANSPAISRTISEVRILPEISRNTLCTTSSSFPQISRSTLCSRMPNLPRIPGNRLPGGSLPNIQPKAKHHGSNECHDETLKNSSIDSVDYSISEEGDDDDLDSEDDYRIVDGNMKNSEGGIDLKVDAEFNRSESQIRESLLDQMEFECQNEGMGTFLDDTTLQRAVELRNFAMHPQRITPPPPTSTPYQLYDTPYGIFGSEFRLMDSQQLDSYSYESCESSSSRKTIMEQLRPSLCEIEHLIDKNFDCLRNKLDDELSQSTSDKDSSLKPVKSVRFAELPPKRKHLTKSKSDPTQEKNMTAHSTEWNKCFLVAIGKNSAIKKETKTNQLKTSKHDLSNNGTETDIAAVEDDDPFEAELIEREMKRYIHWLRHDRALEQHRWFSANNVSHRHLPLTTHQVPQPIYANNQLTESSISAKVAKAIGMYSVLPKPNFEGPAVSSLKVGIPRFPKVPVLPPIASACNEWLCGKTFRGEVKGQPVVSMSDNVSKYKRNKRESNKCRCKKGNKGK